MKQATKFVKDNKVKHLLVETSVDKKLCKAFLKKPIKIFMAKFLPIQLVKGSKGDSYYNMMKYNIDIIHNSMK